MIEVFNEVHKINPNSVLILVGDGELKNTIEEKVKEYRLENNVIFTGVRNDVADLLSAMDVFVFPSIYEGLGIVVIEAQASGLPVISSDTIPKESKITDLIEYLPLKENAKYWAEKILNRKESKVRKNRIKDIIDAGYDISTSSSKIERFYKLLQKKK